MATYAIGDVQGCYEELMLLLEQVRFEPTIDRLWLVGDLVNRGPGSLQVLRWARSMGESLVAVLGNHDLHLLALAMGVASPGARDTLDAVLAAPDREDLVEWLRWRPLLWSEAHFVMVHAGLTPQWSPAEAQAAAQEAQELLRGPKAPELLRRDPDEPPTACWHHSGSLLTRARLTLSALTRLRTCSVDGVMALAYAGTPKGAAEGQLPWFEVPGRRSASATVVFGHWAALGLRLEPQFLALDSGCVWGNALTAVRLEDRAVFQQPAVGRPCRLHELS